MPRTDEWKRGAQVLINSTPGLLYTKLSCSSNLGQLCLRSGASVTSCIATGQITTGFRWNGSGEKLYWLTAVEVSCLCAGLVCLEGRTLFFLVIWEVELIVPFNWRSWSLKTSRAHKPQSRCWALCFFYERNCVGKVVLTRRAAAMLIWPNVSFSTRHANNGRCLSESRGVCVSVRTQSQSSTGPFHWWSLCLWFPLYPSLPISLGGLKVPDTLEGEEILQLVCCKANMVINVTDL